MNADCFFTITSPKLRHFLTASDLLFINTEKSLLPSGRLDMCRFVTDKYDEDFLGRECQITSDFIQSSGYKAARRYLYKGKPFEFFFNCWNSKKVRRVHADEDYQGLSRKHKIQINPRRFENYKEFEKLANGLFGKYKKYHLTSIHASVLLPSNTFSVGILHECLYVKNKQISDFFIDPHSNADGDCEKIKQKTTHLSPKTSFSIGDQNERVVCYLLTDSTRKKSDTENKYINNKINIEVQMGADKCNMLGFKFVEDLKMFANFNPFESFVFFNIYEKPIIKNKADRRKSLELWFLAHKFGYHHARAILNKNKNFKSRYEYLFPEFVVSRNKVPLKELIFKGFNHDMKIFFS